MPGQKEIISIYTSKLEELESLRLKNDNKAFRAIRSQIGVTVKEYNKTFDTHLKPQDISIHVINKMLYMTQIVKNQKQKKEIDSRDFLKLIERENLC